MYKTHSHLSDAIAADVAGFATSLGRSGGNITGLSFQTGITIPPNVWAPTDTVIK